MMNSSRWSNKWTYSTSCTCAENESAEYICSVLMYSKVISVLAGNIAKLKLRHLRNVQGLLEWKWYAWSTQLLVIQIVIRSVYLLRVKRSRWNCEFAKTNKKPHNYRIIIIGIYSNCFCFVFALNCRFFNFKTGIPTGFASFSFTFINRVVAWIEVNKSIYGFYGHYQIKPS